MKTSAKYFALAVGP